MILLFTTEGECSHIKDDETKLNLGACRYKSSSSRAFDNFAMQPGQGKEKSQTCFFGLSSKSTVFNFPGQLSNRRQNEKEKKRKTFGAKKAESYFFLNKMSSKVGDNVRRGKKDFLNYHFLLFSKRASTEQH